MKEYIKFINYYWKIIIFNINLIYFKNNVKKKRMNFERAVLFLYTILIFIFIYLNTYPFNIFQHN